MEFKNMYLETIEDENLAIAVAQHGFKLEFDTANIFDKICALAGCNQAAEKKPRINYTMSDSFGHRSATVDVYAKISVPKDVRAIETVNLHFIVECKGTKKDNKLVLIEQSENEYNHFSGKYCLINTNGQSLTPSTTAIFLYAEKYGTEFVRMSYTGDFFEKKGSEWKKVNVQDDKNHLFKGIRQAINASIILANKNMGTNDIIVPLIVTNADILLKNYNNSPTESSFLKTPWVLHQHDIVEASETSTHYIPYVFVVSLDHLENFIRSIISLGPLEFGNGNQGSPASYPEKPTLVQE